MIEFGFVAALALADLRRVPVTEARSRGTGLLRQMTDNALRAARDRALDVAHSRYRLDKFFGGIAWHCIAHAIAALLIVRYLHPSGSNPERLQFAITASNTVLGEVDRLIGTYVGARSGKDDAADVGSVVTLIAQSAASSQLAALRTAGRRGASPEGAICNGSGTFKGILPLIVGGYAWQIHGWLIAISVTTIFLAALIALKGRSSDGTRAMTRTSRTLRRGSAGSSGSRSSSS